MKKFEYLKENCTTVPKLCVLAQVAQGGCEISTRGDTENPSGHGPGPPALGGPA